MATETAATGGITTSAAIAIGAGIAIGLSAFAAAWSQGALGSAIMGLVAERPEMEKNVLIWLVLPEILALLGFVTALMLIIFMGGSTH